MTITAEERAWWRSHPELADVPRLLDALADIQRERNEVAVERDALAAENARLRNALQVVTDEWMVPTIIRESIDETLAASAAQEQELPPYDPNASAAGDQQWLADWDAASPEQRQVAILREQEARDD